MILRKFLALTFFFLIAGLFNSGAVEVTKDQFVRLVLDDQTGNFSLYYLVDPIKMKYEPLFNDKDPRASFSEVSVRGRVHRLGFSRSFETRIENHDGNPAVIHESAILAITKVFYPVKTVSYSNANGIKIGITIKNKTNSELTVGFRMLIDTNLGEGREKIPFNTDTISITKETLVEGSSGENFWISRGTRLSLMGSITSPYNRAFRNPDFVHFANWKKLNDVKWKAPFHKGRSFNYTHYSVDDSAVCYYYEPELLDAYSEFEYEIFLTTEDIAWYQEDGLAAPVSQIPAVQTPPQQIQRQTPQQYVPYQEYVPYIETESEIETISITPEEDPIPVTVLIFPGIPAIIEAAIEEAAINGEDENIVILLKLQEVLDQFINGEIVLNEQDLLEVEMTIEKYGNRNK